MKCSPEKRKNIHRKLKKIFQEERDLLGVKTEAEKFYLSHLLRQNKRQKNTFSGTLKSVAI